jgi:hypothetical protein
MCMPTDAWHMPPLLVVSRPSLCPRWQHITRWQWDMGHSATAAGGMLMVSTRGGSKPQRAARARSTRRGWVRGQRATAEHVCGESGGSSRCGRATRAWARSSACWTWIGRGVRECCSLGHGGLVWPLLFSPFLYKIFWENFKPLFDKN